MSPGYSDPDLNGRTASRTAPNLRATSSADFRLVPSVSMNVVGWVMYWSVSLEAIQMKRGASSSSRLRRPALTKCQRSRPSAVAQPTHEPVASWSLIFHHVARRSLAVGIAGAAATMSASTAWSKVQSSSAFGEGLTLRMRFGCLVVRRRVVRRLGAGMAANLAACPAQSKRSAAMPGVDSTRPSARIVIAWQSASVAVHAGPSSPMAKAAVA